MTSLFPFSITSPLPLAIALFVVAIAALIVLLRRPLIGRWTLCLCGVGMICLALAAGGPVWERPSAGELAVMVDLSPSTRTADFRTRAQLIKRLHALLGKIPYHIYYFASDITRNEPSGDILLDLPAERTVFSPPAGASAVVVFSDARFDLPAAAPPTYIVIDPLLESPNDAAVTSLQVQGREVVATTTNNGPPRHITLGGTTDPATIAIPVGPYILSRPFDAKAATASARLDTADAWPENDQLKTIPPPVEHREQWWVGSAAPSADWRVFMPAQLPTDAAAYLTPSVIVLQNIAAINLDSLQLTRLGQYVRDLGGALMILGGDRAFAAGGYPGSELEALSPLASTPPRPTTHWILLADGSGSMNDVQGGISLWHQATDAIVKLIPHLPPDDLLSTGSFAESLTWWTTAKGVRETISIPLPPANVTPHGPTNLEDCLRTIANNADGELPKQLLLLSDAEAEIKDPAGLEALLHRKNIHLHLLAIAEGSALPILRTIVRNTGGTLVTQVDPQKWTDGIETLMRAAAPKLLGRDPLAVRFVGDLASLPNVTVMPWNRTWVKKSATLVGAGTENQEAVSVAARWNLGEGTVAALAFDPDAATIKALTTAVRNAPRDPRFRVTWETAAKLRIRVDASDPAHYINGTHIQLELSADAETTSGTETHDVPQTGPGGYELELPAPRVPTFAAVRVDGRVVDRIAIAGRYAPEFDAIGNDHDAMRKLALKTGGQVIAPRQIWPIDFRWPVKRMALTSLLAIIGGAFILTGLGWWKMTMQ